MFTTDDVVARLKAGESAQEVAESIADVLNAAIKQYDEEQRRAEAERLAAEKVKAEKQTEMENITRSLTNFFSKYYSDELLDQESIVRFSKDIIDMFDKFEKVISVTPSAEDDIDDDVLRRFLAKL